MEKLLIWDAESTSPVGDWTNVIWRGYATSGSLNSVSIPHLIEEKADSIRSRYLALIYELGEFRIKGRRLVDQLELRTGFSYWWLTLLAEKCNFAKSPQINDVIRLLAFTDWANGRTIDRITLASANHLLAECLYFWCVKSSLEFEWKRLPKSATPLSIKRRIFKSLPTSVQALVWMFMYLVERWPLHGVGLKEWRRSSGKVSFVSYFFNLVSDSSKAGRFESRYWAHLPDILLHDGIKTNWLHLYMKDSLLPNAKKAAGFIEAFNKTGQDRQVHVTLDTFLSLSVILRTLKDWAILAVKTMLLKRASPIVADQDLDLWPLFKKDWQASMGGQTLVSNLLQFNLFKSATISLPKQHLGIYLQENQAWEFAFINSWKTADHGKLIGCPHSSVRFWDLRYYFDPRSYRRVGKNILPLPDKVALNGQLATDAFLAGKYPFNDLVQVEALRYLYLKKLRSKKKLKKFSSNQAVQLLVLGDYLPSNTRVQMRLLEQAMLLLSNRTKIIVKSHPAYSICAKDYPNLRLKIVKEPLDKLLYECDLVYSSSTTTASLDAICAGVPLVSVLDPSILNMSPLRGNSLVQFASTPHELASIIGSLKCNIDSYEIKDLLFNLDFNLSLWRKLIKGLS